MCEYRRRLPHIHPEDTWLFLTWRLWGSSPAHHEFIANPTASQVFVAQDRAMDRSSSRPFWLKDPRIGEMVAQAIQTGKSQRHFYELCAWVVMPNHVHMLIVPNEPVSVIMHWLKGTTARSANRILDRTGQPFWQDESWDHYLRNSKQVDRAIRYIENNPVTAGLVASPESWPWSSATGQAKARPTND